MTSAQGFFSAQELLGGLPSKRASMALFAIENRTARLAVQSQAAMALYLTETAAKEREKAFLDALALGRGLPVRLTIQDLERFAPHWASLAPEDASVRAAVAHMLAAKYSFTRRAVPQLRVALGLDSPAAQQAYQRLYGKALETIYAPDMTPGERLRWSGLAFSRRLEALPPFWMAFALTLPGAAGLLALPVALAQVGLVAGILLLILFGLINLFTVAALAEAVARSGISRFGLGFLGQLVHHYLGQAGSLFMTVVLAANNFFVLIIFYIGFGGTLASSTHLPATVWIALLFGIGLYFLSRGSMNSTVTSVLVVVFVNLVLLVLIPVLVLPHFRAANLAAARVPLAGGQTLELVALQPVFGILLSTYFSHFAVAAYGPVVLRRDPTARAWIWGSAAAILAFMLISCLWMVTVSGAIPAEVLAKTTGTVLVPLVETAGPAVGALGSVLVVLSLGLASIQIGLGLFYLVQERLPIAAGSGLPGLWGKRGRFMLSISPVIAVFLLAEWLAITGLGSFASLLGILSALVLPLLGGIFPVLLLASTRRKGDFIPGVVYRLLGNPLILTGVYLFFLSIIFAYGLFIFDTPVTRIFTLLVGCVVLGVTVLMLRRGALAPRVVVELRDDQSDGGHALFAITARGEPMCGRVELNYGGQAQQVDAATGEIRSFALLSSALFHIPAGAARELKVWVHRLTPEGSSQGVAAHLAVREGETTHQFELSELNPQVLLSLDGAAHDAEIALREARKD